MKINQDRTITSRTDFFYYAFRNILLISLPLTLISTLTLSLTHVSADNSSADNLAISIPSSCTLNATVNTVHFASTLSGTYVDNIGTTTLKTMCNDANGFSIYSIGSSDSTEGNTKLISSASSSYDIVTGTATSGNISNWAMKLTLVSGAYAPNMTEGYNNQYVAVPNTWTKVASRPANTDISTDSNVAGSSLTTTYAVYANSVQPAGTYTGQVKYLLVHPNNNSMNLTTLQMAFDDLVGPENKTTFNGKQYYRMQDMTTEICNTADVIGGGSQIQLVDDRINLDGEKRLYWVAKLADDNCWMTQNLDLDLIANHTYTHADTDLGWSTNSFDPNATWTLTGGPSTIPWNNETGKFTGWENNSTLPYSANPGEKYYYTSNSTVNDTEYSSLRSCVNDSHTDCEHYSVGNYYNWTAAIASNDSSASQIGGNISNSICPAGWRLPNVVNNDEFGNLLVYYDVIAANDSDIYNTNGFNSIRVVPLYFVRSGSIYGGSIDSVKSSGFYYSASVQGSNGAYYLSFDKNNARARFWNSYRQYRYSGQSVRCLAR